ncbi:interleukin-34 [Pelobates cultripes]|uniref:Interleukin-34 n=1 Tax=Pelobates cultripes TaxID=61616 RepID=A0AAD1TG53_PELCU|nr:interleukin-34 [Pelobates cultripes]
MESAVLFLSILVLGRAAVIPNECKITEVLNDKLQYEKRLMYMSDYFPLDYKFLVKHEEVLRCHNITNLRNQGIPVKELRYLWGIVNERILFKMKSALPGRHPSLQYVTDLAAIFKELLKIRQVSNEIILGILTRLKSYMSCTARIVAFLIPENRQSVTEVLELQVTEAEEPDWKYINKV